MLRHTLPTFLLHCEQQCYIYCMELSCLLFFSDTSETYLAATDTLFTVVLSVSDGNTKWPVPAGSTEFHRTQSFWECNDTLWYYKIFVNCDWVSTLWQQWCSASQFPAFLEPEPSLRSSQRPAGWCHLKPDESRQHNYFSTRAQCRTKREP